jgi:hypothetical protein
MAFPTPTVTPSSPSTGIAFLQDAALFNLPRIPWRGRRTKQDVRSGRACRSVGNNARLL